MEMQEGEAEAADFHPPGGGEADQFCNIQGKAGRQSTRSI